MAADFRKTTIECHTDVIDALMAQMLRRALYERAAAFLPLPLGIASPVFVRRYVVAHPSSFAIATCPPSSSCCPLFVRLVGFARSSVSLWSPLPRARVSPIHSSLAHVAKRGRGIPPCA